MEGSMSEGTEGQPPVEEQLPTYVIEGARSSRSRCKTCRRRTQGAQLLPCSAAIHAASVGDGFGPMTGLRVGSRGVSEAAAARLEVIHEVTN